ncbi:MAG: hypothetical protein JW850_21530 [Thermoflexales bacterium]|nr:hypothetical protein [Thermoflexales bacterium]
MFQDLTYSLEIAAHTAGLEHYALHMDFDAVTAVQRYHESFALEDWLPPFHTHAEIEFEIGPLDTARSQLSQQAIAETIGATFEGEKHPVPIITHLDVTFSLAISALGDPSSDEWTDYCSQVADRKSLQAGLENLKRSLQRAIGDEAKRLPLHVQAHTTLAESGRLVLSEISAHWRLPFEVDIDDSVRQARLEKLMSSVHTGLVALNAFAQDIGTDFEAVQHGLPRI